MNGDKKKRWCVILAGGDGVRLKPLTRLISGDDRPKQFCPLFGGLTLLEHARQRAERNIPADQIVFSLSREHEEFYLRTLWDCPTRRVVQPQNRGTLPAILSSLLVVAQKDPEASVAVFPSDHYFSDESIFAESVEQAFELVRRKRDYVAILGARPNGPEVEYGWIQVGASVQGKRETFLVQGFHEKPPKDVAQILLEQGSLWNTFVMIGKVVAFLEMICSARPGLLSPFRESLARAGSGEEVRIEESLYAELVPGDFSRHVLARESSRLMVQCLGPTEWSDLGDCDRAAAALSDCWRAKRPPNLSIPGVAAVAAVA